MRSQISRPVYFATAKVLIAMTCSAAGAFAPVPPAAIETKLEHEQRANMSLSSFGFSPHELHLKAGQAVLLRVANDSSIAHDLTAPEFFAATTVRADSGAAIPGGKISLSPHEKAIITLIPRAGRYPIRCSHPFHKMLGMSGTIVVEP